MRKAGSNCDLRKVKPDFPYLQVLLRGRPERGEGLSGEKHPPMDRQHRAKIFAPFDALDGFSEQIRQKNRLCEEAAPEKPEESNCEFREDPSA